MKTPVKDSGGDGSKFPNSTPSPTRDKGGPNPNKTPQKGQKSKSKTKGKGPADKGAVPKG